MGDVYKVFQFVCLFCPSALSIAVFKFLNTEKIEQKESLTNFLVMLASFCAINNIISLILIKYICNLEGPVSINGNLADTYLSKKFLIVAVIVSIIVAVITEIINKYFRVKITIED